MFLIEISVELNKQKTFVRQLVLVLIRNGDILPKKNSTNINKFFKYKRGRMHYVHVYVRSFQEADTTLLEEEVA